MLVPCNRKVCFGRSHPPARPALGLFRALYSFGILRPHLRVDLSDPPSLDGADYLDKIDGLRRAYYARGFALHATTRAALDVPSSLGKDLEIAREGPACSQTGRFNLWFNSLFQLTRSVAPLLPAPEASRVWMALTGAPCLGALSGARADWIGLLRAVARRDARNMSSIAERLLDPTLPHTATQRQYLVMAAMTGYLAVGERDRAAAVWKRNRKDVEKSPELALRLLYAHAFRSETKR